MLLVIFFIGCKKESTEKLIKQEKGVTVNDAKVFLNNLSDLKTESENGHGFNPKSLLEKIDWKNASQIDSGKALIGKFEGAPTENGIKIGFRKALFFKDSSGDIDIVIIEFVPDLIHLWKFNGINKDSFDGKLFIYDKYYKPIQGFLYENGKIKHQIINETKDLNSKDVNSTNQTNSTTCSQSGYSRINGEGFWEWVTVLTCTTDYFPINNIPYYSIINDDMDSLGEDLFSGGGTTVEIPEPYLPGEDDPKVNGKKMMDCFENISSVGATYKATLYVKEPLPGTPFNVGTNSVGHAAIGLTKTGANGNSITQIIGFYPSGNKLKSPGELHNNGGMDYNVSLGYNISSSSFNSFLVAISNPLPEYDLLNFNCASYVYTLGILGGINTPSPYNPFNASNIFPMHAKPANMGNNMRENPNSSSSLSNSTAPASKGECN